MDKADIRLMVYTRESKYSSTPSLSIELHPVTLEAGLKVRNLSWSDWGRDRNNPGELADLQLTAQLDQPIQGFYAEKLGYRDVYLTTLIRAEAMVKVLRKVQRTLDRLEVRYGRADDFVTYAARVAEGIGASGFMRITRQGTSGLYDDAEYVYMDANALRWHLDDTVAKWAREKGLTA